ncbi:MAG TPA: flagellar motor protein MotB [Smithellaceae bacterium]|nr:flagellar motor protein MotB [Smithellaceae bacterium]
MEERPQQIIIKRVKKKGGGGAHGGSWKVAYADFVTAMMAFFLLLWLLSMVSDEQKASVSNYFNKYSLFKESGVSAITDKSASFVDPKLKTKGGAQFSKTAKISPKEKEDATDLKKDGKDSGLGMENAQEVYVKKIRASVDEKMAGARDQILIDAIEGGVRIQIVDAEGSIMFPLGSDQPTSRAREILKLVSENIKTMPGRIVVEGHTDAAPFRGGQITNWELSTMRASAARRELEQNGIEPSRIARVVGYADTELLIKLDPRDARNRRISIIILQSL